MTTFFYIGTLTLFLLVTLGVRYFVTLGMGEFLADQEDSLGRQGE
jgi:hypothetical protein